MFLCRHLVEQEVELLRLTLVGQTSDQYAGIGGVVGAVEDAGQNGGGQRVDVLVGQRNGAVGRIGRDGAKPAQHDGRRPAPTRASFSHASQPRVCSASTSAKGSIICIGWLIKTLMLPSISTSTMFIASGSSSPSTGQQNGLRLAAAYQTQPAEEQQHRRAQ